jgi:hypothetical protein
MKSKHVQKIENARKAEVEQRHAEAKKRSAADAAESARHREVFLKSMKSRGLTK